MGLLARGLEMAGIATVVVAWNGGRMRAIGTPRTLVTKLDRSTVFGMPGDRDQQRRVLEASLGLLEQESPLEPLRVDEGGDLETG